MTSLVHSGHRGPAVAAGLALVVGLLVVPSAAAKGDDCVISNDAAPGVAHETLQTAVDAAANGDTVRVEGTCVGTTTITKPLTIIGGHKATLDGNQAGPVLTTEFASLTVIGLTITNGMSTGDGGGVDASGGLTIIDSTVVGNVAVAGGGGIGIEGGVTLINTTVIGNSAAYGGGIAGTAEVVMVDAMVVGNTAAYSGGGIATDHGGIILNGRSSIHHNTAIHGGGVTNATNFLVLNNQSSIHDNTASGDGGGVWSGDASVYLNDASSISRNTAGGNGGGMYSEHAWVTLSGTSTISRNIAGGNGGGVANADAIPFESNLWLNDASSIEHNSAINGGGVYNGQQGLTELQGASSIDHNLATGDGGGIWNSTTGRLTNCVAGSTVMHNRPGDIFLEP